VESSKRGNAQRGLNAVPEVHRPDRVYRFIARTGGVALPLNGPHHDEDRPVGRPPMFDSPPTQSPSVDLAATPLQDADAQRQSQRLSAEPHLPPGNMPGYEIDRQLGAGAYGSVWLARELKTGKQVAIKFYTQRRGLNWTLLSREVEKLAVLYTSRNIVGLLDVGWDHDPPYFVMEYLEAGSLDQRLRSGALPVEDAVRIATGIARALEHAHRSGILHCDLKPANVLLDVNSEPRLGDFGQSRLTTEQSPSFGTLFYMAPEQSVVDGVPDVRWDVYALGALLYHTLTGQPPYATAEAEQRLSAARSLPLRLETYRQIIAESPRPDLHRGVAGVDLPLAELVDGCLQPHPAERIPSVQRVLDLLEERDRRRSRRSLVALGFLGPILFLLASYWIAESAVPRIVAAAEQNLIDRALASDAVTARILAESVQHELLAREAELTRLARHPDIRQLLRHSETLTDGELRELCRSDADVSGESADFYRWMWTETELAQSQLTRDGRSADDSWFLTDERGRQVFRWPQVEADRPPTLGRPFHWRDYFHGGGRDFDPQTPVAETPPRTEPGVSRPFRSQATDQYIVAIAVPIQDPASSRTVGVLARTIALPELLQRWEVRLHPEARAAAGDGDHLRFLALADTRSGAMRLLDHPGMTRERLMSLSDAKIEQQFGLSPEMADVLQTVHQTDHYRDPAQALDPEYTGEWLAAAAPVGNTGWMAIVQEQREHAVQPVDNLRRVFLRAGFWSLGIFSALLLLLWYLMQRATV
jgi:hypothetical protein